MTAASYGDHWRNLRRISALEIFSTNRLNMFLGIRRDEVKHLLRKLSRNSCQGFAKVELKSMLLELTFNIIMRMVAGKRYYGEDVKDEEEARQFKGIMKEIVEGGGASNAQELVPLLRWIDHGRLEKRLKKLANKTDAFLQGLIDEKRSKEEKGNTMIDHLLSLQTSQPEYYTDQIIKGLMLVLLIAGTDTSAVTLEWAMSNLLNHSEVLKKARVELDNQIGQEKLLNELDVSKLHYLQNIISETLRLHPAVPLLLPHMSSEDCTIGGYNVPRRRACPGASLAQRTMGLTLGSLIQCFEWERISEEEVDMVEGNGLTMPKAVALEAMCKARPIITKVLSMSEDEF
nr:cytochrome p450 81e8 [Quercus suber]